MERVSDFLLGDFHHPHAMLILQIGIRVRDLATNCSCHNHFNIFVHTASIPEGVSQYCLIPFLCFIPVIVATEYLSDTSCVQLIQLGHPQVFLHIEVLLVLLPVFDEPRDVLEYHHMRGSHTLCLIQLLFQPGFVCFVFSDCVSRIRIKLRVQDEEGDTVLVK